MQLRFLADIKVFSIILLTCLIIFLPTIFKPFLCDDYKVMYRIINGQSIYSKDFFRPLSDLSLYLCYQVAGLNSIVFNIFNLIIHSLNCFILYSFCRKSSLFDFQQRKFIAITSSLLFLVYPFHNESIVWIVGLGSNLSSFFGFLALIILFSGIHSTWKYILVSFLYFLGLLTYETILPLPLIVIVVLYKPQNSFRIYIPWIAYFSCTVMFYLIVRLAATEVMINSYGNSLFTKTAIDYILNTFKVFGKLVLPPSDNSVLLAFLLLVLFSITMLTAIKHRKSIGHILMPLSIISTCIALACIIPIMFGVSTHTSEGNRLIYFASFFLMIWLALLVSLIRINVIRLSVLLFLSIYFLFLLVKSNTMWQKAGEITYYIIDRVSNERANNDFIDLVNIPEEFDGAFIFRNGFKEALLINNVDTSGIRILRMMTSIEARKLDKTIIHSAKHGTTFVPPNTYIIDDSIITVVEPFTLDTSYYRIRYSSSLLYWNKHQLINLSY